MHRLFQVFGQIFLAAAHARTLAGATCWVVAGQQVALEKFRLIRARPGFSVAELHAQDADAYISSNFLIRAVTASGRSIDQKWPASTYSTATLAALGMYSREFS